MDDKLLSLQILMESGGTVLWIILLTSILMWTCIAERYLFIYFTHPKQTGVLIEKWRIRSERRSWSAHQTRKAMISSIRSSLQRYLMLIKTLTVMLPMLGLLGTVDGMILTFDVLAVFGTGNARGMAGGISIALITTMAGLLTALSGLYFSSELEQRIKREVDKVSDKLVFDA